MIKNLKPISLAEVLALYTKSDLDQIRRDYKIKGISQLSKRDLVPKLAELLPEKLALNFATLNEEQYKLIKQAMHNQGYLSASAFEAGRADVLFYKLILFPIDRDNNPFLVIPEECMQVFRTIDSPTYVKQVKQNSAYITLTRGLLYHYGVLSLRDLISHVERLTSGSFDYTYYIDVLHNAALYYDDIRFAASGLADWRVEDPEALLRTIQSRSDLDYYPYTKEQIIQAGEEDYLAVNKPLRAFKTYMQKNYSISNEEIHDLLDEYLGMVKQDIPLQNMVQMFIMEFEVDSEQIIQEVVDLLVALNNNSPKWTLKGYVPTQLRRNPSNVVDLKTYKKTGRNQPCTCGSGKKHKQCCGK
ncbi:YecA family protein [Terribacillus sp. DMT04]|uniref:YecA family protein n=1 Tax=Terribacillus sp. DMT04 TaxID=2850441 RepID=UPI001C2C4B64|nr:SEC-C metal-binding domain-containing protein [Terribacillus sp. DMT04]QXE02157.1 SEC-C domain-containing protein [Terribacillus sp. DMT04]